MAMQKNPACKWAYKQKGDLLAHIQRGKLYDGASNLLRHHAAGVAANQDLKKQIMALRKRKEAKERQKEKVRATRKRQFD